MFKKKPKESKLRSKGGDQYDTRASYGMISGGINIRAS